MVMDLGVERVDGEWKQKEHANREVLHALVVSRSCRGARSGVATAATDISTATGPVRSATPLNRFASPCCCFCCPACFSGTL